MRIVFADCKQALEWVKVKVDERYDIYRTSEGEIVFAPNRSTAHLPYGYVKVGQSDKSDDLLAWITASGQLVFSAKRIEWASDKAVGIKSGIGD